MGSDATGVLAKLGPKVMSSVETWPSSTVAFCLSFPCAFLILQLLNMGVLLCRQSRSRKAGRQPFLGLV